MLRTIATAGFVALFAVQTAASAQHAPQDASPTRLMPFAGVLADSAGNTTAAARGVTFALFDEREGGTLLWSETQTVAADRAGRFLAYLGSVTPLPLEIFRTEQARWLEVTVDGRALPRTMLVAVPYALRAADAETLGGKALSDFVLSDENGRRVRADGTAIDDPAVDGTGVPNQLAKWNGATTLSSSIISESFDNRIGILAPDPTGGGAVDSRVTIRNPDNNTAISVLSPANGRRFALNTLSANGWILYDGVGGAWQAGIRQREGNVGIGTTPFGAKLDVRQSLEAGNAGFFGVSHPMNSNDALRVVNSGSGAAVVAIAGSGPAGEFTGDVTVTGTLTKGGGAFQIDHPLDPVNKYLSHSFVESPDMMNVYNGNTVLNASGEAWVTLPDWFEALNRDFRYQLTPIGAPGRDLHVAVEVTDNRFKIAGGRPGGKVSWQVTGIRQDAWANANRIPVEHDKSEKERGRYLHPAAFNLPASQAVPSAQIDADIRDRRRPQ